jgi:hypothetical protein
MSAERDERYAKMLLTMGRTDADRMARNPQGAHRSIALWVAHELADQSRRLDIGTDLASSMREVSQSILDARARARRGPAERRPAARTHAA